MNKDFYSGLMAGIISNSVCNPFDVIRVNKQLKNEKFIRYNPRFLSRGLFTGFIAIPSFWSIYLELYNKFKIYNSYTPLNILNGYIASCISSTIVCPLYVIRFKHQTTDNFNIVKFYKDNGIKSFYNGLVST